MLEATISARQRDIGDFTVRRVLPFRSRREVGPFTFLDHSGPVTLPAGQGLDVKPHPHIGIATLSYLFEGEIVHRDSLGSEQLIRPGEVNWMVAGRGIVHSERSPPEARRSGARLHGLQIWIALPPEHEETEPSFEHHDRGDIPRREQAGVTLDVIAGTAFGLSAPTRVLSPTLCVHAVLERGARLALDDEHERRGAYVVEGLIESHGSEARAGTLLVFRRGGTVTISATEPSRLLLLGGAELPGERFMDWNFVSSSKERLQRARGAWQDDRFPRVPGDELERVPLPGAGRAAPGGG